MRIRINEKDFDIENIRDTSATLLIWAGDNDVGGLSKLINGKTLIEVLDENDTVVRTVEGTFGEHRTIVDVFGKRLEFTRRTDADTLAALNEHITNIELALCEIYENMEV